MRIAFWTPPTPARDSASGTSEREAWRSGVRSSRDSAIPATLPTWLMAEDARFPDLVVLAAHDPRPPLAAVHGFAHPPSRLDGLEEPVPRYVGMIAAATEQLAVLIDQLALAARIEAGRYDPVRKEVDTLGLARAAAAVLGEER